MRAFHLLPACLIASVATAIQLSDLQPFLSALPNVLQDLIPQPLQNETAHELLKRQSNGGCPNSFRSCANLGAPSLCCMSNAVCSADTAGYVACCPSGAACTGTIGGVITAGTLNSNGALATDTSANGFATTSVATTTSMQMYTSSVSNGLVIATSTEDGQASNSGFVIAGSSVVATPGSSGMRRAQTPLIARAVVYIIELLPL
ncbi:hypothetical protein Slin15195_G003660 [Septoria linicola]|uniref:Uncharacterized protein n=1 Tax=Septoria linicola TaxID=215465 RepID=A0A9Q9ADQ2_9PEZI|nr:hypothetical protein Slin14017_G003690 [Septoria linicola]USW47047.1 hypothetical protein Slin15195_G003660 [Septoria linicola]